jgi:hypothetical protein
LTSPSPQLEIRDDDHASFTLYKHQMGTSIYLSEGSIPLSNEALLDYCFEDGQVQVKGILAVQTSLNDNRPGVPLVPPPSSGSSPTSSGGDRRGDRLRRGVYRQGPGSESASSVSDGQAMGIDGREWSSRVAGEGGRGGGSGYQASVSETSVSEMEVLGGPSNLHRKPHARRPSGVDGTRTSPVASRRGGSSSSMASRSREASSPRTSLDGRGGVEAGQSSTLSAPNQPSQLGRGGSITPTPFPAVPITPSPSLRSINDTLPVSFSSDAPYTPHQYPERSSSRQQQSQTQSYACQQQYELELHQHREREEEMSTQEALRLMEEEEKRLADLAALEWERKDREEEEERKRRQIQADHEAAMKEQRREQALYEVSC